MHTLHLIERHAEMPEEAMVSFVIPVYNEERCLADNVSVLEAYAAQLNIPHELVLVNDGSTDASLEICLAIAGENPHVRVLGQPVNRGKGFAVRTGMLSSRGVFRIFMDADLAVPVDYIENCIACLAKGADVVIGSRHLPGASIRVPEEAVRQTLGGIYRRLVLSAFGLQVTDITCGLKGFGKSAAEAVFRRSRIDRWGYDAEILFLAQHLGLVFREIPVDWYHSFDSDVHIIKDSFRTLVEMFQIYFRYAAGRYHLSR